MPKYIDEFEYDDIFIPTPPLPPVVIDDDPTAEVETPGIGGSTTEGATSNSYSRVGIVDMAWAREPYRVLWCVRSDGLLLGLTYRKDQNLYAWHRHQFRDAAVESVAVIPRAENANEEVWLTIRRTINGIEKRYIERFVDPHLPTSATDTADYNFLDSSLSYNGTPQTTFTGLDHLEGQSVSIWADGARQNDRPVAGGSVTLDSEASIVHIGVHSDSVMRSLPPPFELSKTKTTGDITTRFYQTIGGKSGRTLESLEDLALRDSDNNMDMGDSLLTGNTKIPTRGDYRSNPQYYVVQDIPAPMTILGGYAHVNTGDR